MMQFSDSRRDCEQPRYSPNTTNTHPENNPGVGNLKSTGELFAAEILPNLRGCNNFSLNQGAKALPSQVRATLESPENRAIAWSFLGINGASSGLTQPQRHALITGLLTHLQHDRDTCMLPLTTAMEDAVAIRDYRLYQAIGEAVLEMSQGSGQALNPFHTLLLVAPFAKLSVPNVRREDWLKPWIELFSNANNEPVHAALMNRVHHHVRNGEISTYDHLLTVLCNSHSDYNTLMLARSVNPAPIFTAESFGLYASPGTIVQTFIKQTTLLLPFCAGMTLVTQGASSIFSWQTVACSAALGSIISGLFLKDAHSAMRATIEKERSFFMSRAFMHYAESVYQKLSAFRETSHKKAEILELMEAHPAFAARIGKWQAQQKSTKTT